MRPFSFLLLAQMISLLGTHLTGFVLGLWVFKRTGSVTAFALINCASLLPEILFSSVFGVLVDRWERRWALVIGHAGAGVCMLLLALQYVFGTVEVWQIIFWVAMGSVFNAFQFPAFSAATTMLVPSTQLGRAQGMAQLGVSLIQIASPALASFLLLKIQLEGVFLVDVVSFVIAIAIILRVRVPRPPHFNKNLKDTFSSQIKCGWNYVRHRPGLLSLLILQAAVNFNIGIVWVLFTPLAGR